MLLIFVIAFESFIQDPLPRVMLHKPFNKDLLL